MPPVVTLLTDFGTADAYVAEMKAALLRLAPEARLVDVTHEVPPGDLRRAAYLLGRVWGWFPVGTVHLAVVDPGVGTARRALAAVAASGHRFVAPDNGILTPVLDGARVVSLPVPPEAAATFHGRDLFAPAAARLANDEPLDGLGVPVSDPVRTPSPVPLRRKDGVIRGEVVYVDRFGTLVTNIGRDTLTPGATVVVAGRPVPLGRTFGDVVPGGLVGYVGSGGTLEIAVRNGSAAEELGLDLGAEVRVGPRRPGSVD